MNIIDTLLIAPIVNLLLLFYSIFSYLKLPGALGWSIIAVTAGVRLAINPLMQKQIEQSKKLQEIQPELAKFQKKYKKEPLKLQQAQLQLYKKHKVNPGSGCLIFIIQMPIFIGLYNALSRVVTNGAGAEAIAKLNEMVYFTFLKIKTIDVSFFGLNLHKTPAEWQSVGWWYLLIPVITAGLQLYQARLSSKSMTPIKKETQDKNKKKDDQSDFQSMMQKQMVIMFPLMIGWLSFRFPVGLALYWNIFTLFGIWQYISSNKPVLQKK